VSREAQPRRRAAVAAACLLAAAGLASSGAAAPTPAPFHGALAREMNLADLAAFAGTIVHARVLSARVEPHPAYPHLTTVVVTLQVEATWKGHGPAHGGAMTYRQFLWDPRDRLAGGGYAKGQDMLLFLTEPGDAGLSAPVGLDQGRIPLGPLVPGVDATPAIGGPIADRLLRNVLPSAAGRGITLASPERALLARAAGRPLALRDAETLVRALTRSTAALPAPTTSAAPGAP
jgi:hypothetical protein